MITNTKIIEIDGAIQVDKGIARCKVIARFTSDKIGETLSLSYNDKIMIIVPFEDIEKLIEKTRMNKN